jgi:hypothetical protein
MRASVSAKIFFLTAGSSGGGSMPARKDWLVSVWALTRQTKQHPAGCCSRPEKYRRIEPDKYVQLLVQKVGFQFGGE